MGSIIHKHFISWETLPVYSYFIGCGYVQSSFRIYLPFLISFLCYFKARQRPEVAHHFKQQTASIFHTTSTLESDFPFSLIIFPEKNRVMENKKRRLGFIPETGRSGSVQWRACARPTSMPRHSTLRASGWLGAVQVGSAHGQTTLRAGSF